VSRLLFRLRPEEAVALAFLLPTTWLTVAANLYAREAGVLGARHPGGLVRLAVAVVLAVVMAALLRFRSAGRSTRILRDVLPFLLCILVYTNLHDTIGFVNPHDVHHSLVAMDVALFGVEPTLWAERFITPARTEWMQFFYANFSWLAPSASLILLGRRRFSEFRAVTLAVMTCFFLGYFLYVLFPAAPPRLVLQTSYTKNLYGYPQFFSRLNAEAFALLPVDSRAAFPSLHTAVTLVMLACAWRHLRAWFFVALPFVVGLWVSTIYLRHHYAVDLLAGFLLAPVALYLSPRLDRRWAARQRALGIEPARGVT
jgi:membrane-associated phospholipid phosphatase